MSGANGNGRQRIVSLAPSAAGARPKASATLANPAWQDVPAVRERQVHVVRDEWLNTPGPPLMEGIRELFRILHPELARSGRAT